MSVVSDETPIIYSQSHVKNDYSKGTGAVLKPPSGECFGTRHFLAFMAFLGFVNVYCLRVNLSVGLVAMVNDTDTTKNTSDEEACAGPDSGQNTTVKVGEFNWDQNTQGIILGSFFYGYICTQIIGGKMAEIIGGKRMFGFGVLCTAVLTMLTPLAARAGLGYFIALRIVEGIGEGVTFPAMHAMWGQWAPIWERSKLAGFSYAGAQLGTVIAMPICGILADSNFLGGWPSVFYVFGVLGCVWFVAWMLLVHDTPAKHPRISKVERDYIEKSIGVKEKMPTPWLAILTSPAVWATSAAHFANNWGFYTMLTCLPTYMKDVLKFDIKSDGFVSALPYLVCWMSMNISCNLADFIRSRGFLSTLNTRLVINSFGLLAPAILMSCIGLVGCNYVVVVVMLTFAVGLGGFCMGGYNVNHLDLAPNFSGTLMGITNMIATIPGFLGPYVVGVLTNNQETRGQWQKVFYISAGVYVAGTVIFVLFARGTEQSWNKPNGGLSFRNNRNVSYSVLEGDNTANGAIVNR
ncbi:sialin-like isoform X3 [Mytilus galloprovincialis]|uniref:sialin-like isoform X2 n=1 Tax=Mytilus galloprovincialis TaxID=29158 RepID=UPI003F7BD8EB